MARLKLKQVLSNLQYNAIENQLILSGSSNSGTDFIVTGSIYVTSSQYNTGSVTIDGIDSFGDSGSYYTVDLGDY